MNQELGALLELLGMLITHRITGVLIALLVLAAAIDWRTMRIPNWLTVSGMAYGLAVNTLNPASPLGGLFTALSGLATGLLLLLPLYALRILGAGDVKLMAMVGAFIGVLATLKALVFVFVVGGLAAIVFALSRRALAQLALNVRGMAQALMVASWGGWRPDLAGPSLGKLPYGISICIGTVAFLAARQLGYA